MMDHDRKICKGLAKIFFACRVMNINNERGYR